MCYCCSNKSWRVLVQDNGGITVCQLFPHVHIFKTIFKTVRAFYRYFLFSLYSSLYYDFHGLIICIASLKKHFGLALSQIHTKCQSWTGVEEKGTTSITIRIYICSRLLSNIIIAEQYPFYFLLSQRIAYYRYGCREIKITAVSWERDRIYISVTML